MSVPDPSITYRNRGDQERVCIEARAERHQGGVSLETCRVSADAELEPPI